MVSEVQQPVSGQQMPQQQGAPDVHYIAEQSLGSHDIHWQALTSVASDVRLWLQQGVDDASLPRGICPPDQLLPENQWLIQAATPHVYVHQLIDVEDEQPTALHTAFPVVDSPYQRLAQIKQIITCSKACEAVLHLHTQDGLSVFAFDALYAVNAPYYQKDHFYPVRLSGLAYQLEAVDPDSSMLIEDTLSIRRHRALQDILEAHAGVAPDNLEELIGAWQPTTPEDEAPVTVQLGKMAAYLFGDQIGQEDEAWFQGEILGLIHTEYYQQPLYVLDIAILRESNAQPLVVRMAVHQDHVSDFKPEVGMVVRGNAWIVAQIDQYE